MLNIQDELDKVKACLPEDTQVDESRLWTAYDKWYNVARSFLRLRDGETIPPATAAQLVENTVASYNARGDEGLTGSGAGQQSYTYRDMLEELKKVMLTERKARL